ncbi:hypothetical protein MRS44_005733 [Fusarium solani]|uniref:uncharacterized protein n=1 Tax=Fusarium solani TaxID=169388 RepID=UPI0032C3DF2F|nr:hypothetical protein MRS44_005733 [Fusarium solani]
MPSFTQKTILAALAGAIGVAAHGHVNNIVINGAEYAGYDVFTLPYSSNPPVVVGWSTTATDNGFVAPDAFGTADIICHKDAKNAKGHAKVAAGDSIFLQWDTWPESHKGPYASDELIKNGNGWLVKVPETIKPGFYVLRHEIIALHSGGQENGAQNYPQCFNLEVTGSGTEEPEGTLGTELYKADDAGILFNIYTQLSTYPIPGPKLIAGGGAVAQSTSAVASTATPLTGGASAAEPTAGSGSGSAQPSSAPAATTAAPAAGNTEAPAAGNTEAPAATQAPTASDAAPTPIFVSATTDAAAAQPTQAAPSSGSGAGKGCKSKRSKKVRRHARDVKARNVAPMIKY